MKHQTDQPTNPYISAAYIMAYLDCSKPTAYEIMRQQPSYICIGSGGRGIRVLQSDFENWLQRQRQKSKAELQARMYPVIRQYTRRGASTP